MMLLLPKAGAFHLHSRFCVCVCTCPCDLHRLCKLVLCLHVAAQLVAFVCTCCGTSVLSVHFRWLHLCTCLSALTPWYDLYIPCNCVTLGTAAAALLVIGMGSQSDVLGHWPSQIYWAALRNASAMIQICSSDGLRLWLDRRLQAPPHDFALPRLLKLLLAG